MKLSNPRRLTSRLFATAVIALTLTSCGKSSEMTENIPADVDYAVRLNLRQPLENAGCTVTDNGVITLPDKLLNAISDSPAISMMVQQLLSATEGIDLSDFYFFEHNGNRILLGALSDSNKVSETFTKYFGSAKTVDGMKMFSVDGQLIFIDADLLWIPTHWEPVAATNEIKAVKTAAKNKHIGTVPGLEEWLAADNTVAAVISGKQLDLPSQYRNDWMCGSLRFDGNTVSGELALINDTGKREPLGESFGIIDTDFLRYIPDNSSVVVALGPVENPQIKQFIGAIASNMDEYSKFLTSLDGTISIALDMSKLTENMQQSLDIPFTDIEGIAMVHYPDKVADELVTTLCDLSRMSGQQPEALGNGQFTISEDGLQLFFGNIDGYFAISTSKIQPDSHNAYTPLVSGKRGVIAAISTPNEISRSFGVDYSTEAAIWLESDCIKGKIELKGTSSKFLEAFIDLCLNENFRNQIENIVDLLYEINGHCNNCNIEDYEEYFYEPDEVVIESVED